MKIHFNYSNEIIGKIIVKKEHVINDKHIPFETHNEFLFTHLKNEPLTNNDNILLFNNYQNSRMVSLRRRGNLRNFAGRISNNISFIFNISDDLEDDNLKNNEEEQEEQEQEEQEENINENTRNDEGEEIVQTEIENITNNIQNIDINEYANEENIYEDEREDEGSIS